MAHLSKLAIRGIRSFDDKNIAIMEFFSPVTVIVGHNGSGKTTIIECLKYATTGDQPPNTRGGAFIHDPKMANEKEVKAQVKLRFFAANGQKMLAVRNLSVTMKKNGALAMKTLESILGLADNIEKGLGKRGVISTKCAEMDTEIPHLLGVSKAVLENVIFCHQEDSYWPLSEPAALKKKFDDIFEATKYTKALDNIKSLRKDRMSELKAEEERLLSLKREKEHADKLSARIKDINENISELQAKHEELRAAYDQQVRSNQILNDTGSKFREIYIKAEQLNDRKTRTKQELDLAKENLKEIPGTDAELTERMNTHDDYISSQRQKRVTQQRHLDDAEEQIRAARSAHVDLMTRQGQLIGEEKTIDERMGEREVFVHELAAKFRIRGFDALPLEREQASEFLAALVEQRRRQQSDTDKLQADNRSRNEAYNLKSRQLHAELEGFKQERRGLRERGSTLQQRISDNEREVDAARVLTSRLAEIKADIEDKRRRLEKARQDVSAANFEKKIQERSQKTSNLELKREDLNTELRTLSLQADSRAKLDLQRANLKAKASENKTTIELCNAKFRSLVGVDARPESMEQDLDQATLKKEREQAELESTSSVASKSLQAAQTNLAGLKAQMKAKREEIKSLDKRILAGLEGEYETVDSAVEVAAKEVGVRNEELGKNAGTHDIYQHFLEYGQKKQCCPVCTRTLKDGDEVEAFQKNVKSMLKKSTPEAIKVVQEELADWESELKRLQELAVLSASRSNLQNVELPAIEKQINAAEAELPSLTTEAEEAAALLAAVTKDLKEIAGLRQHAAAVAKNSKDIERLEQDIASLESDLASSGSTKTADDVQKELDDVTAELRTNEREKANLVRDQERQLTSQRQLERELHQLQLDESDCKTQLRDKDELERRIEEMKGEIAAADIRLKDIDGKIADAQAPIEKLDREHRELEREANAKVAHAQTVLQDLGTSVDRLTMMNKWLEKNSKEKMARKLKELNDEIEEKELDVQEMALKEEQTRAKLAEIDQEINQANLTMANLRDNMRFRRLKRELEGIETELSAIDMEEAAKAKRIWTEKWTAEKQKETDLQSKYSRLGGEINQLEISLKSFEKDQEEFKDISKRYRSQLVKVKISDMANNDLEKYAKALDNAIMKYHSLKMEEVNDTMRHLWNKTYQGTDIDGIKICSDSEGGATKRSYNYRVVMTKDQVEMDMRGRCSAGQKMLASIIIRLALADSFGQNCGILALDEPTNALDTENIDALAASLVDIINERKNHANFQLIIITHDENFLAKLGQSNVMEHYWRVSRDSRQKSIIERHRFG